MLLGGRYKETLRRVSLKSAAYCLFILIFYQISKISKTPHLKHDMLSMCLRGKCLKLCNSISCLRFIFEDAPASRHRRDTSFKLRHRCTKCRYIQYKN